MSEDTGFKYSAFTPVLSRKKRKNKTQLERPPLLTLVQRAAQELSKDDWISRCLCLLQDHLATRSSAPSKILCLGLGSPSSSPNSRAQLALLLEICKATAIEHCNVSVYDPVFTEEDDVLFKHLDIRMLAENKASGEGRYPLEAPTILWMPHCDLGLYENVLAANWSRTQLSYIILISNRLGDYVDSTPKRKLETMAPCVLHFADIVESCILPACTAWTTAFNSIAIQSLRDARVCGDCAIGDYQTP
ncbi:SRR1-domain-containing protein [Mycena pura]|uniref:SRR1-domain-containing protein n=1 Tax=Mycena pura TaxID=153505 RepID=A0AAD6VT91_9AGAR|nr:SRR1-domain-containing protein [Mycena pura]